MAVKGKNKSKKNKNEDWSEIIDVKSIRILCGIILCVIGFLTFIALVSYIFTWKHDVSLLFDDNASELDTEVANMIGLNGFRWAHFLISKLFGFGAFAVPFFFFAFAFQCLRIKKVNLLKALILTFFGSVIISILCAFVSNLFSFQDILGNGPGGSYGYYINDFFIHNIGKAGTGCVLLILFILWLFMCSRKFADWFDRLFVSMNQVSGNNSNNTDLDNENTLELTPEEEPKTIVTTTLQEDDNVSDEISDEDKFAEDEIIEDENSDVPLTVEEHNPVVVNPEPEEKDAVEIEVVNPEDDFLQNMSEDDKKKLFDPRLDLSKYQAPPLSLLDDYSDRWYSVSREELESNKNKIVKALANYNIKVVGISAQVGPTVTLYKIKLDDGMKVSQVRSREEDIALALGKLGVRIVVLADAIGIEVPNEKMSVVPLKGLLSCEQFKEKKMELPMALGITVTNEPFFLDLAKLPHLLVAGATGTGKSVGLNVIINSLIFSKHPAEMKLVVVDPKQVEFSLYANLDKHFLAKLPDDEDAIITDTKKVIKTINSLCKEMDDRYTLMKLAHVRQIGEYNKLFLSRKLNPLKGHKFMPYIVVIIDEFADLIMMAGREIEQPLARLAQKARAIGIHLIFATQRPTTTIINGNMKSNFNTRISFKVMSSVDSKTILDTTGANRLIGRGDMLVLTNDLIRVQCALIDTEEIKRVVKFIGDQRGYPETYALPYVEDNDGEETASDADLSRRDALFEEAAKLIVINQLGSTSLIQRKLGTGYARAGKIMDQLSAAGITGPANGSKPREVLVSDLDTLDKILTSLDHAPLR